MSTQTPLTDAAEWTAGVGEDDRTVVFSDVARSLEIRVATIAGQNRQLKEVLGALWAHCVDRKYLSDEDDTEGVKDILEALELPDLYRAELPDARTLETRLAATEAELERVKGERDRARKQRDELKAIATEAITSLQNAAGL